MSLHLMECVRPLRLNPSTKLALLAFADSADHSTHIAFPGLEAVMEWANVSRSRAAAIVAELVDVDLLQRHRAGHRGRRAEFVVFPLGCCDAHPRPDLDPWDGATVSRCSITHTGPACAGDCTHPEKGPAGRTQTDAIGSCTQDSVSVKASRGQDPIDEPAADRVLSTGPSPLKGSCLGTAHGTPSSTTTTSPQPPTAPPPGEPVCAAHPTTPGSYCRACGTSPRTASQRASRAASTADRDRRLAEQAARAAATRPPVSQRSRAAAASVRAALQGPAALAGTASLRQTKP